MIRIITITAAFLVIFSGCSASDATQYKMPLGTKAVPEITFKNLTPPYLDYDYLAGNEEFGFQYEATAFSIINAWWLAEISTLVYAEEEFVRARLKSAGLNQFKFFDKLSTQCYVANNENYAVVAFRGSEIWKKRETLDFNQVVADLRADVDIRRVDWPRGGKVHRGFMEALEEVWHDLLPYMRLLEDKGCKIWITGHSLGGALAVLCGAQYANTQGIYTYGSPWVGDENFKKTVNTRIFRIVNGEDIVPRIPSFGIFVHVGELKVIDGNGFIGSSLANGESSANQLQSETSGQPNSNQSQNSVRGFIPAPFRDHVPLLYAVHLWNNLIANKK